VGFIWLNVIAAVVMMLGFEVGFSVVNAAMDNFFHSRRSFENPFKNLVLDEGDLGK
jgi:hypothetical protein